MFMTDPISRLRGLTNEVMGKEQELRTCFKDLEQSLKDATSGVGIQGHSENCLLEPYGDDDAYYGYLYFDADGLGVAFRTREEDMEMAFNTEPWEPIYRLQGLDKCSAKWLRALAVPKVVESLITNITSRSEEELASMSTAVQALAATTNLPLQDVGTGLVQAAKDLTFDAVIKDWNKAQSALATDPPDATTRACSLVETVCKHILDVKKVPLPAKETVQQLYGAAARALTLAPEQQTSDDLRIIAGSMHGLVNGIGALRTHAGSAHGKVPGHHPIEFPQARLAVNAAGVLATFLLETLKAERT
jgi:hypothetical protein